MNQYFTFVNTGSLKEAYESFSSAYKAKTSFAAFEKEQKKGLIYMVQTYCTNSKGDTSSEVEATVIAYNKDSKEKKTAKVRFQLVKEANKWKINAMGN